MENRNFQDDEKEEDNNGDTKQVGSVIRRISTIVKDKGGDDNRKASFGVPKKRRWYHFDTLRAKPKTSVVLCIFARLVFFFHCANATVTLSYLTESYEYYIMLGVYCVVTLAELMAAMIKGHLSQWKWCCTSTLVYSFYMVVLVFTTEIGLYKLRIQNGWQYCTINYADCATSDDVSFPTNRTYSYNTIVTASRVHQQILVFFLIVGRWLLPKDNFSRESLAQLLLVLIGSGEDIVEFVSETMTVSIIGCSSVTVPLVLILWSISLQQFSVALPQMTDKQDFDFDPEKKVIDKWIGTVNRLLESRRSTIGNLSLHMESVVSENMKRNRKGRHNSLDDKLSLKHVLMNSIEVREALVTVILQDGPFLFFRLYVISVSNFSVLFYVCKNLLVILLHAYRIYAMMVGLKRKRKIWSGNNVAPLRATPGPYLGKSRQKGNGEMVEISRVRAFSIIESDEDDDDVHELVLKESAPNNIFHNERKRSVRFESFSNPVEDCEIKETEENTIN